jgi:hypothetical protein
MPKKIIRINPGTIPTTARLLGKLSIPINVSKHHTHLMHLLKSNRTIADDLRNHQHSHHLPRERLILDLRIALIPKDISLVVIRWRAIDLAASVSERFSVARRGTGVAIGGDDVFLFERHGYGLNS